MDDIAIRLAMVFGAGIVVFAVLHGLVSNAKPLDAPLANQEIASKMNPYSTDSHPPDVAVPFGYKCSWLAIRNAQPEAVIKALKLRDVQPCPWPKGIQSAYENACFVSPPIGPWVLVVSFSLPNMSGYRAPNKLIPFLRELSAALETEVQSFSTHRIVEYHAWARANRGQVLRAYAYIGESGVTLVNDGEPSPEEQALGVTFLAPYAEETMEEKAWDEVTLPDESHVMELAAKWSLNPTELGDDKAQVGTGWLGHW